MNWDGFLDINNEQFDVDVQPEDIVVRQSTAESYFLCPGRVGHAQDEGFKDVPSFAMSRGSFEHLLIERHLTGQPRLSSTEELVDLWYKMLLEEGHDLWDLAERSQIEEAVAEARVAYFAWVMWYQSQQIRPAEVERLVIKPLGVIEGRRVWIQGTPDYVATNGDIYDWKTAGRAWPQGKEMTRIQAAIYTYLAFDDPDWPVTFRYLVWAWDAQQWEEREVKVTEENVSAALMTMWQIARAIHTQSFPYTPQGESYGKHKRGWHCSPKYCSAWEICPGRGLIHDDQPLDCGKSVSWRE